MFENMDYSNKLMRRPGEREKTPSVIYLDKTHSILKQIVREWSSEGESERRSCFQPILDEIDGRFQKANLQEVKVLVPGAGLGRLAFEIAKKGYTCEGNECSLFMLLVSNFILNKCKTRNAHLIHPWVHQYHNNLTCEDQTRGVYFPDVNPSSIPKYVDFSMAAGNFVDIYSEKNKWDCVATCFFIDTGHNIVAYIETIWRILKSGGVWINLGPLLYHYADMASEDSIEPSYDVLKEIITSFGFKITKDDIIHSHYTQNPESLLSYSYKNLYFVCEKPS